MLIITTSLFGVKVSLYKFDLNCEVDDKDGNDVVANVDAITDAVK